MSRICSRSRFTSVVSSWRADLHTRIRACFAFIKHFGLQFGTGGQDNNDTGSGGTAFQEFETKIQSLETCLQQRNNEIAILVNMVKQGKEFEEKVPENNTPKRPGGLG